MNDGTRKRPYTTTEVAQLLGVSYRTVIRECEDGHLRYRWSHGHGRRLVRKKDLDAYITKTS